MDWIAVIDDDVAALKNVGTILSKQKMHVTALKSGRIALEYFRKNGFPDLILLDVNMPETDGFETLRLLKRELPRSREVPVIFLTAESSGSMELLALEAGAMDYIRKPFDPGILISRVRKALDTRRIIRQLSEGAEASRSLSDPGGKNPELDLETVTAILEERIEVPGSLWLGRDAFSSIYKFMVRYMERYHSCAFRMLLTLKFSTDPEPQEREEIIRAFRQAVRDTLRNSDVMMECGETQLFLFLPEVHEYDDTRVAGRLLDSWKQSPFSGRASVSCEYAPVRIESPAVKESRGSESEWIVVVDDDRTNLLVAENTLSRLGVQVTALSSGTALLETLKGRKPDLILLDLMMPDPDGIETFRRMRREYAEELPPVIFLTADGTTDAETRCLELGAMDFIRKPFLPDALNMRVRHTLELIRLQKNLADAVVRKTKENESLSLHVVQTLAEAIDAKDRYTIGHSSRVAAYAREIGRRCGYTVKQQEDIYMMGLLHDVGKIGIPDSVINKTGRLTEEEYAIVKTHPVMGSRILGKITEMPKLSVGARWHHERYDGTGYPDGLAGKDILEEARIIAVADAYDAMTSQRSYRDMLPQEAVIREIRENSGTQFDPVFAEIMLQMIAEDPEYRLRET